MLTSDFDYPLAPERIAQAPAIPRDSCKMLVLNRKQGQIEHRVFSDIINYLKPNDLLVVNETKVMPARLVGKRSGGGAAEVLLLKRLAFESDYQERWEALVRPGRRLKPGSSVYLDGLTVEILGWASPSGCASSDEQASSGSSASSSSQQALPNEKASSSERGQRLVRLTSHQGVTISEALHKNGRIPLPPYITSYEGETSYYQTVYAKIEESTAAPTAGLHFTPELMERIRASGIRIEAVNLAVGLDTFRPITAERIEDHAIHSETYSVTSGLINAIRETRRLGGRVIAVGTTTVRCLESAWDEKSQSLTPRTNEATSLYITPGYEFRTTDALLTNFHVPRSTLLALVSAFATRELIMTAYLEALAQGYRFLSFGDAMLIL